MFGLKDKEFAALSALLKEQEARFVPPAVLRRAAASHSLAEALGQMSTPREDFSAVETLAQGDDLLRSQTEAAYEQVYSLVPHRGVVDLLALRYEFDSLKTALFTHFAFSSLPPIYVAIGEIPPAEYAEFFRHQDPFKSQLPDYLLKPAQRALSLIKEGESPAAAQQVFPHSMYRQMLSVANQLGNLFITQMVKTMIDLHNAQLLVTTREQQQGLPALEPQLIEGGSTSTSFFLTGYTRPLVATIPAVYHRAFGDDIADVVALFEKTGDLALFRHLFRYIQQAIVSKSDLIDYGPEVPFRYLLKKEYEIGQIRTVLYGVAAKTPVPTLLQYLHLGS